MRPIENNVYEITQLLAEAKGEKENGNIVRGFEEGKIMNELGL
ncbi:hypothetical protein [Bacillus pseudomycoides]|nr:hypothetical protein [Bacillus pseudomycoides]